MVSPLVHRDGRVHDRSGEACPEARAREGGQETPYGQARSLT